MEQSLRVTLERIQPLEIAASDCDCDHCHHGNDDQEAPFCDDEVSDSTRIRDSAASRLPQARRLLYLSRFCYHISELTWNFGSALWLAALGGNTSLFWVSAYYLAGRILIIAVVPILSSKIDNNSKRNDNNHRSRLVTGWIIGQHIFVMLTILLVVGTLQLQESIQDADSQQQQQQQQQSLLNMSRVGLVLICLCGGIAEVLHNVLEVAINRDWIVVMAEQDSSTEEWLQETNVMLRQILLGCEIVVPFLTGSLLSLHGDASLWVVFWLKGISMGVVAASMHKLCQWVPALQRQQHQKQQQSVRLSPFEDEPKETENEVSQEQYEREEESSYLDRDPSTTEKCFQYCCCYCSDFRMFLSQKGVVGAGLGLGFLYANILSFGGIMVAYLAETGSQSLPLLGIWKGLSNVSAIVGTVAFSKSRQSVESKGLWGLIVEATCLSVSVIGIWMNQASVGLERSNNSNSDSDNGNGNDNDSDSDNSNFGMPIGSILLISGTIASRMGLWAYDLSVTQLYQTRVAEPLRGTVGGTQTLLNNAFEVVPFCLTMIVSGVQDFWIVMVVGYCFVLMALVSYVVGTYSSGHQNRNRYGQVEEEDDKSNGSISSCNGI